MTEEQRRLKERFLEPETRDGYYIDADTKAVWRKMLDILEVFSGICDKYGLKWTMEAGSLIGAMRHHGFVPWDDDIDVSMPRRDYDRLMSVLPRELPEGLFMQTSETDPECFRAIMRICDSRTAAIIPSLAKEHRRLNMGIFIDILPVDAVPDSVWVRKLLGIQKIVIVVTLVRRFKRSVRNFKDVVYNALAMVVYGIFGGRVLSRLRDMPYRLLARGRRRTWMLHPAHMGFKEKFRRQPEWYEEFIEVPFEYLSVKVSKEYDAILTQQFGDWRTPVKGGAYHVISEFDVNRGYKDVLREKYGYTAEELEGLP